MARFFEGVEQWGIVVAYSKSVFWFGLVTFLHYFSLFALVGTTMALNLYVLGVLAKDQTPTDFAEQVLPWVWISMVVAIVSGFGLAIVAAGDYYLDPVTRTKLFIIFLGFLCTVFIQRNFRQWSDSRSIPALAKVVAVAGILLWVGAVLAGADIAAISGLG